MKTDNIDKQKLIELYKKTNSSVKTGEQFNISGPTVLKIIRSFNVPIKGKSRNYSDEHVISRYMELGTVQKVETELGMSDYRIIQILDKHNIERKTLNHVKPGDVFGKLRVIEFVKYHNNTRTKVYLCKCECGNTKEIKSNKLTSTEGPIKDCGCGFKKLQDSWELIRKKKEIERQEVEKRKLEREHKRIERELNKKSPTPVKYVVGYKKDRLTIISVSGTGVNKIFTVQCECGTIKDLKRVGFKSVQSCGCLQVERSTTHGHAKPTNPERRKWYDRWKSMISRCYNPKFKSYHNYGGRGIRICDRWMEPNGIGCENYYNDIHNILGPQPSPDHSLDRIDNDGIYEITNLRWATNSEQTKNQRRNIKS